MKYKASSLDSKTASLSAKAVGLKPDEITAALEAGATVLQKAAAWTVAVKAKSHPRGLLAKSVTFTKPTSGPVYGKTSLGWEQTKIKASTRNRENGRKRVVDTVDDYARILEYSPNRQLRHMEEAFEENGDQAEAAMEAVLDRAVDRALEEAGL